MSSIFLINSEFLRVEYFKNLNYLNDKKIVFVFSVFGHRSLEGNPYGGEIFYKNGYDVISFKITNDDWFQSLPADFFEKIKIILSENKYLRKVAYGSSMGGFATLVFSKLLDLDTAIAISPQFAIDESFDNRWELQAKKINFIYRINKTSFSERCNYFIIYDNKDRDELHVQKILEIMNPSITCGIIKIPYAGHPATNYLSEVGILKDLIIKIANENNFDDFDLYSNRIVSKSYLLGMSHNLFKRNHLRLALHFINLAIELDARVAWFYREKSLILKKLGNLEEAIVAIKYAIELDQSNSDYFHSLSTLLDSAGLITEAISASKQSIFLSENNSNYHCHISNLYFKEARFDDALYFIRKAISLDFNIAWFHRQLSLVFLKLNRRDDAIYCLKVALILRPDVVQYKEEYDRLFLSSP